MLTTKQDLEERGPFDPDATYRIAEVAKPLKITQRQARRLLYDGVLPFVPLRVDANGRTRGRRLRGRDLNYWWNSRVVWPEGSANG